MKNKTNQNQRINEVYINECVCVNIPKDVIHRTVCKYKNYNKFLTKKKTCYQKTLA